MLGPAPHLDGKYSAFGRIVEGMEVLAAFEKEDWTERAPGAAWKSSRRRSTGRKRGRGRAAESPAAAGIVQEWRSP